MNECQEQQVWFELWGFDGFRWEFIADFDSRVYAERHDQENDYGYEQTRIKRVYGTALERG
jgi:hypothetical protein